MYFDFEKLKLGNFLLYKELSQVEIKLSILVIVKTTHDIRYH